MSDLPGEFIAAAYSPSTSEAVITLLKLTNTSQGDILLSDYPAERFSVDPFVQGTTHDSEQYVFGIVDVMAPGADGSALTESTIVINNLDGQYDWLDEEEIEDVTVEVIEVLKSDPEIVIRRFENFELSEVAPDDETLALTLGLETVKEERFPAHGMSPTRAPALFPG